MNKLVQVNLQTQVKKQTKNNQLVQVAVGVIINASFEVIMTQRALTLHQGGLWEFPGGKIEQGETIEAALKRELYEEIAIDIHTTEPLISIEHHYHDKSVQLHTYLITHYKGIPTISDGQLDLKWVSLKSWNPTDYPIPAPNLKIMERLILDYI